MKDIDKNEVAKELSEKYNEKVDIAGFYDGMNKSDSQNLKSMVESAMKHKPETASVDHVEIRFDQWTLPKVTIWTKTGLDISENRAFQESYFTNGRRKEFNLDIRPF